MSTITPAKPTYDDTIINDLLHQLGENSASSSDYNTSSPTSLLNDQLSALQQLFHQQ
jgi:hypothetical protein